MLDWIRPSGSEISTNDDKRNIEAAKLLGWKRVKVEKKKVKKEAKHPLLGS